MCLRALVLLVFLMSALAPAGARAAESAPVASARATATLISDSDAVAAGTKIRVALRLRMAPGWHTYWRNPGDAGAPPSLDLSLPDGASAGPIAWPAPARQPEGPVMTYGYSGEVVLPVTITAPNVPPGGIDVTAHAQWLVCANICVPEEGDLRLHLADGPPSPSPQEPLFAAADARTPRISPWHAIIAADGTLAVSGAEISPATVKGAWFVPDAYGLIDDAAAQPLSVRDGVLTLALKTGSAFKADKEVSGLLLVRDAAGLDSSFSITAAPGAAPVAAMEISLPRAVLLAFAGGLILNLMPCVFPILAMKTFSLARLALGERRHAWLHAFSYAAGVLASFGGLAGVLLALRAGGGAAGWGFQFQSPAFVAAMAWLMLAVGLNFSGVFEVGAGPAGAGQSLAGRAGHLGSFFTGLLAVLVATPCTAPFMAVAIGAALGMSAAGTVAVFLALGIGLATPYVLLACVPGATRFLPRPGRWMESLRQLLAFPMYAAAAWLIWVVSQEAGPDAVLVTAAGGVAVGFGAFCVRLKQHFSLPRLATVGALASLLGIAGLLGTIVTAPGAPSLAKRANADGAEPFSAARLADLRRDGRPVFVNMTASWCVTCLVNERIALSPEAVRAAFAARDVAYLKGDWTRQDAEITGFLRAHGRDGVPLYVFFPGGDRPPEILPQILTQGTVLAAIGGGGKG
jgi:thiol:disulfide interchange protein DsbD